MGGAAGAEHTTTGRVAMMPGDWLCPKCGDLVFARNIACRRCLTPKPSGGAGGAGVMGGGAAGQWQGEGGGTKKATKWDEQPNEQSNEPGADIASLHEAAQRAAAHIQ